VECLELVSLLHCIDAGRNCRHAYNDSVMHRLNTLCLRVDISGFSQSGIVNAVGGTVVNLYIPRVSYSAAVERKLRRTLAQIASITCTE